MEKLGHFFVQCWSFASLGECRAFGPMGVVSCLHIQKTGRLARDGNGEQNLCLLCSGISRYEPPCASRGGCAVLHFGSNQ